MKAWRITSFGIDRLELADVPEPTPGPGQVLIRIKAVSLNYRDLLTVKGLYNPRLEMPRIPCSDGAGEIVAVGDGVSPSDAQAGDRVAGIFMQNWIDGEPAAAKSHGALGGDIDGMLAEYVVLNAHGIVPFPSHLSFAEAATLPCAGLTAWNALTRAASIGPGHTVLIQGTGGVSIFALQFAKMLGARVFGISGSDEKLARATALGLDAGVNYKTTPGWAAWVMEQTGGLGVDLVVEVGGAGTLQESMSAVRVGGVIAQIGVLSGTSHDISLVPVLHKQIRVQGVYVGSRADFTAMNRALTQHAGSPAYTKAGAVRPSIDEQFAFVNAPAAFRKLESGSHFGKLVISLP